MSPPAEPARRLPGLSWVRGLRAHGLRFRADGWWIRAGLLVPFGALCWLPFHVLLWLGRDTAPWLFPRLDRTLGVCVAFLFGFAAVRELRARLTFPDVLLLGPFASRSSRGALSYVIGAAAPPLGVLAVFPALPREKVEEIRRGAKPPDGPVEQALVRWADAMLDDLERLFEDESESLRDAARRYAGFLRRVMRWDTKLGIRMLLAVEDHLRVDPTSSDHPQRTYSALRAPEEDWQRGLGWLIRHARLCVFDASDLTDAVRWEIRTALEHRPLKTLVFVAPVGKEAKGEEVWAYVIAAARERGHRERDVERNCLRVGFQDVADPERRGAPHRSTPDTSPTVATPGRALGRELVLRGDYSDAELVLRYVTHLGKVLLDFAVLGGAIYAVWVIWTR